MPKYREALMLVLILIVAGFLRLHNLRTNPAWFTDEATHLDIAQHVLNGEWRYMAVTDSTLYFARPPLFELLLAGLVDVFGHDMLTLRAFTGSLGVLTVGLVWLVTRQLSDHNQHLALLAAAMLAIYPHAVLYSRLGFSYNLLAPLALLVLLGLGEYGQIGTRSWLVLAVLSIGLGGIADLMMFSFVPPLLVVVFVRRWPDMGWSVPLVLLPFGIYAGWMLLTAPEAFLFDVRYTASRLGGVPLHQQLWNTTYNYTVLLSDGFWLSGGMAGMMIMQPRRLSGFVALLCLMPLFMLGRIVPLYSLSFYYLIPLLPLVAIGMAGLIYRAVPHVLTTIKAGVSSAAPYLTPAGTRITAYALLLLIVGTPFVITADLDRQYVQGQWPTSIDPFLIDATDADLAAEYINAHILPGEVVVASVPVAWQIDANTVDFAMSNATIIDNDVRWGDGQTLPLARFHHDPRYHCVRFAVVDNLWRTWGVANAPGVEKMLTEIEQWPLVFEDGNITVYENQTLRTLAESTCIPMR